MGGHVKDQDELWTLALLNRIIARSRQDRDALPGSVVKLVKEAVIILRKRQASRNKRRISSRIAPFFSRLLSTTLLKTQSYALWINA